MAARQVLGLLNAAAGTRPDPRGIDLQAARGTQVGDGNYQFNVQITAAPPAGLPEAPTPDSRPPQPPGEPRPRPQATVAATDQKRARNSANKYFTGAFWFFGVCFGMFGLCVYASRHTWHDVNFGSLGLYVGGWPVGGGGILGSILGAQKYYFARKGRSDVLSLDAEGLSITRGHNKVVYITGGHRRLLYAPLSVRWEALERVAIEEEYSYHYRIIAWFLPDRQPSAAWLEEHLIRERRHGGYVIYRCGPDGPPADRVREALAAYAGDIYHELPPRHVPSWERRARAAASDSRPSR